MGEQEIGAAPAPGGPGAIARLAGVFFSPVRTFRAIAQRPTWLAPLILWIALAVAISIALAPKIDWEKMIRAKIEKSGQTVPEERIASIVERQKRMGPIFYNVGAVVAPPLISLLVAAIFFGSFKAFGSDLSFSQSFGVTTHGFLPGVLGSLLLLPVLLRQESLDPSAVGDLLHSNLGFLVERDSKVLHSLAQSVDLFSFWSLALFVIGFAEAARVSRGRSAGIVVTLWALFVLGKAGVAAIF